MPNPSLFKFTLSIDDFDVSLLSREARQRGTPAFREAVKAYLSGEFQHFSGSTSIEVDDHIIEVQWTPDCQAADPLAQVVEKLKRREYPRAITLLRLFLSDRSNDANLLYNLGMALSDTGKLNDAVSHLRRAVTLAPDFTNARVALGIALQRQGENADAMRVLKEAVTKDPQNAWARRNLGASLLNAGEAKEAEECLREATLLDPKDQLAMFGLAEALANLERLKDADEAYKKAIDVNEHSEIVEAARVARRKLADHT